MDETQWGHNGFPMDDVLIGVGTHHLKEGEGRGGEGLGLKGMMEGVCKVNGTIKINKKRLEMKSNNKIIVLYKTHT